MHPICDKLVRVFEEALYQTGEVAFPLQEIHKERLNTIVKTVYAKYYEVDRFPGLKDKASAFFYLIIKNHPLTDDNKRLSVMWLRVFCQENEIAFDIENHIPLDELAISVERTALGLEDAIHHIQGALWK